LDDAKPCAGLKLRVQARVAREHRRNVSLSLAIPLAIAACGALAVAGWRWSSAADDAAEEAEAGLAVAEASALPESAQDSPRLTESMAARTHPVAAAAARFGQEGRSSDEDELAAAASLRARAMAALAQRLAEARDGGSQPLAVVGHSGISLASTGAVTDRADPIQGEVLRGGLRPDALRDRSPFGAVRSESSLRAMAAVHVAGLAPEVTGSAVHIQRYLASRVPGIGPLPVSEGAGVDLTGARIALLGTQPVVAYMYVAYGVPLTVFSRCKAPSSLEDPEVEALAPDASVEPGVLADQRAGLNLVHVVATDRVMTMVSELGAPALLQLTPHSTWL
jgi:hypothetical protein